MYRRGNETEDKGKRGREKRSSTVGVNNLRPSLIRRGAEAVNSREGEKRNRNDRRGGKCGEKRKGETLRGEKQIT